VSLAVALEAGICKPGNVCPERAGSFSYPDILVDAFELQWACRLSQRGAPLGLVYREALGAQRSTLTGYVILAVPLMRHLSKGLDATKRALEDLKASKVYDAQLFLKSLSETGLSHYKKVEGFVDADEWWTFEGNLWDLFLYLSKFDDLFREIVKGYPLSLEGALRLIREGYSKRTLEGLQRFVLSNIIDSLVARKHGYRVALGLNRAAKEGYHSWYIEDKGINPGTAADIIAVSILLALAEEAR